MRRDVGCDVDQKNPKRSKCIQVLIMSLNMPGVRPGIEGSENYSQLHSVHSRESPSPLGFLWEGDEEGREKEEKRKLGGKKRKRKMRVGLQAGENNSEELISHTAKEAHN